MPGRAHQRLGEVLAEHADLGACVVPDVVRRTDVEDLASLEPAEHGTARLVGVHGDLFTKGHPFLLGEGDHLALAASRRLGGDDVAEMLAEFRERPPGVAINMVEDTQADLLARLRADELDCAFTAVEPDTLGDEYAATLIWEEEFVVALPPGHRLASQDQITFDQLAGEDLIAYRENSALRRRLERTMAARGLAPRNAFICTEMAAVRALVSKGLGLAVIPRSVAEMEGPAIALRPIGPEDFTWPVALVWRAARRQPAAAKAFLAVALGRADGTARPQLRVA